MLSQVQSPNPTPPETALISASWFPTTAFLQLRPFAISCNLYSYLFIETQCEHCCTFCCCDFDISLIAGFLLPPPPAGSGPCNIVYLYHDVSQCITMHSNICCTPPPAGYGLCLPYLLIIFFAVHCNTHIFQGTFMHCKIWITLHIILSLEIECNILYFVAKHCVCTSYEFLNYLLICALVFVPVTCLCTLVTVYFSSCALVTVQCTCYTCYFGVCTCLEGQQRRDARLGKVVRVVASYGFAASIAQYAGEAPACWQSQYPPGEHMEIAQRLTSSGQTQPSYSGNI